MSIHNLPAVTLSKGREASLKNRHPWIFSGAIGKTKGNPRAGDYIAVFSSTGEFLATGHYAEGSIAVRVLSRKSETNVREVLASSIRSAYALRANLGLVDSRETTAYRLVNAEGDSLPGLVIDIYQSTAVVQLHSEGMQISCQHIVEIITDLYGPRLTTIIDKSPHLKVAHVLVGDETECVILENGIKFKVDIIRGQKTGFYLDQRDSRRVLASFAKNRTVLNAFCYTGGFSVYCLSGGAKEVLSVDASESAIAAVTANIELNFPDSPDAGISHSGQVVDCMKFLQDLPQSFDMIVLDPPAFVKHQGALRGGLNGYETINSHAIRQIASGGLIATFSCSQFVDRELFRKVIFKSASRTGRSVRIIQEFSQAACHPVSVYHPEGVYLKGFLLYVED